MVFTTNTLQGQSSIHQHHLFESLLCQLRPQQRRNRTRIQASDDKPVLAGKPSLSGPPKRAAPPVQTAPQPPSRNREQPGQRDNGDTEFNRHQPSRQEFPQGSNGQRGRGSDDRRGGFDRRDANNRRDRQQALQQQPAALPQPDAAQAPAEGAQPASYAAPANQTPAQHQPLSPPSATEAVPGAQPDSQPQIPASMPAPARPQAISGPPARPQAISGPPLAKPVPNRQAARPVHRQELPSSSHFSHIAPPRPGPAPQNNQPPPFPPDISQQYAQLPVQEAQDSQQNGAGPTAQAAPAAPAPPAAGQPTLASKPALRAPPSRSASNREMPLDLERIDFQRMPPRSPQPRQQNGSQNGAGNGQRRQPAALTTAPGVPGGPLVTAPKPGVRPGSRGGKKDQGEDDDGKGKGKGRKPVGDSRRKGKIRVDAGSRRVTRAERKSKRAAALEAGRPEKEEILEVGLEGMSVQDLAEKLAVGPTEVVRALFMKGIMAQVNQVLDFETVQIAAEEFEVEILEKQEVGVDDMARKTMDYMDDEDLESLQARPPVVVVMGHVDHGKTSLLDHIRKTKVAAGEAGGITQAIGAYTVGVDTEGDIKDVTFLDTPGHEAFSAMRARGARVTDIAVIVVAADDGVRPQTLEAISHAKAAEVPIVVAINKIDKDGANPERVKQELSEAGLLPEEWGGKTPMIPVVKGLTALVVAVRCITGKISAKMGTGVDDLLETVALVAELEDLMSNPDKPAGGTVLEAHLDRRVGAIATLLVQTGTLHVGDVVIAGSAYGKVRSMKDNVGEKALAYPSTAVQMSGLNAVPIAGDDFIVAASLDEGRKIAEAAGVAQRVDRLADQAGGGSMVTTKSLASFDGEEDEGEVLQRLNVILKADASGSMEAVKAALGALPQGSVVLRYLLAAPNDITISDVDLAAASRGLVLGFNVEPSEAVLAAAKHQGVTVRSYKVIYDLLDDMRAAMEGKLAALEQRIPLGEAEVRAVFGKGSKLVAGCMVTEGSLRENCFVVVHRGKRTVYEGTLSSLRRVKESVKEIDQGNECGVGCKEFIGWEAGDKIEAFELVSKRRTLEDIVVAPQLAAAQV